jgi:hypothetical protein
VTSTGAAAAASFSFAPATGGASTGGGFGGGGGEFGASSGGFGMATRGTGGFGASVAPSWCTASAAPAFGGTGGFGASAVPDGGGGDFLARDSDWRPNMCMQEEAEEEDAAFDGGEGDAWGDNLTACAHPPLATLACCQPPHQPDEVGASQKPSLVGDKAPTPAASSACDTSIRGQDIERALAVCDNAGADVAPQKCKAVRRTSIFGRRHNNKENKEPAPHTEPQTKWVTCAGTCQGKFGWSVGSQQYYHAQNKKPPRFCDACATQRNNKRKLPLEYGHVICDDSIL